MKLEISKKITVKEVIEIEFPCYYKHDLMPDDHESVIYGKVEADRCTTIQASSNFRGGWVRDRNQYRTAREFRVLYGREVPEHRGRIPCSQGDATYRREWCLKMPQ